MANLQTAINKLQRTTYISSNQQFDRCIARIDKYFDRDEQKAFMLGYLFANKDFINNLPKDTEEMVIHANRRSITQKKRRIFKTA